MSVLAPEPTLRSDPAPRRVLHGRPADSLEVAVAATWEQLESQRSAACPVCAGAFSRARDWAAAACGGCGSVLS